MALSTGLFKLELFTNPPGDLKEGTETGEEGAAIPSESTHC